jgi:CrcB protein
MYGVSGLNCQDTFPVGVDKGGSPAAKPDGVDRFLCPRGPEIDQRMSGGKFATGKESIVHAMGIVALGGACGAVARYWIGVWVATRWPGPLPLGTILVNLTGSFFLGVALTALPRLTADPTSLRLFLGVGFLGAYTTFSTFEYETLRLLEEGEIGSSLVNVITSLLCGLLAVWLGATLGRRLG